MNSLTNASIAKAIATEALVRNDNVPFWPDPNANTIEITVIDQDSVRVTNRNNIGAEVIIRFTCGIGSFGGYTWVVYYNNAGRTFSTIAVMSAQRLNDAIDLLMGKTP